jgi:hypothetical protein
LRFISFFVFLFAAAALGLATPLVTEFGETLAPYPVQENGPHIAFSDLTKDELGRKCSVYLKPGRPCEREESGNNPDGVFAHRADRIIVNGEFNELGKKHVLMLWSPTEISASFYSIPEEDIAYIVFASR